ncbi:hypothetical protein MSAN_02450300 [Mycena sanguinolenta]|uniref:Uncharacterized protein n=1 Tax=Mycena sanguinolenta TaxID=230812 RepID=A0A8H6WXU8_9AGAR|nr:hypothetical protein MSAN_02450300 [Mycena sanguinolenta]
MDEQPNPNTEFAYSTTCDLESPPNASGMFAHSQKFTVTGGTFTNITNYTTAPFVPSDLRIIPMGDIDLRHQIRVDECTVVAYSQRQRACVRRMHSAKARIDGRRSRVTVAIYQGNDAEKEWRKDIAKYMSLRQVSCTFPLLAGLLTHTTRHPNIIQICGVANSNGIHAAIFNDDLIPLQQVLDLHRDSHFSTVYIYAHCNKDFMEAFNYILSEFERALSASEYTSWIRRSTGRLCAELTPASGNLRISLNPLDSPGSSRIYLVSTSTETITTFINLLTLEQYHRICGWNLGQHQWIALSADTTVNMGAVLHCSIDRAVEIAFLPSAEAPRLGDWTIPEGSTGEVMPNGWTRFSSSDLINNTVYLSLTKLRYRHIWLSQANHVFFRLHIMPNFADYVNAEDLDADLDKHPADSTDLDSEDLHASACENAAGK